MEQKVKQQEANAWKEEYLWNVKIEKLKEMATKASQGGGVTKGDGVKRKEILIYSCGVTDEVVRRSRKDKKRGKRNRGDGRNETVTKTRM